MLNIILVLQLLSVPSTSQGLSCVSLFQQSQIELSDEVTEGLYKLAEDQVRTQKLPTSESKNMILREIKRQVFEKASEFDSPEVVFSTYRKAVAELSALLKDSVDIINARNLQIREKQRLINEFILKQKKVEEIKKKYNIEEIEHIVPIAADRGEVADLKFLISLGIDLNYNETRGYTALELSVINRNYEMVSILIEAGAAYNKSRLLDIFKSRDFKHTDGIYLHDAANKGDLLAAKFLLWLGISPLIEGYSHPYLLAVKNNHHDIAKLLLESEIQELAISNHIDIALATEAKIIQSNYKAMSLFDALNFSIEKQNIEEIKILFQSKVTFEKNHIENIYKSSSKNEVIRNLAILQMKEKGIHKGYVSAVIKILSKYNVIHMEQAIMNAIELNNKNDIVILQRAGIDKNTKLSNGETLTTFAASIGNFKMMDYFLEQGADIKATNASGKTAYQSVIKYIANKISPSDPRIVLFESVTGGHYEYTKRLIKSGENIEERFNHEDSNRKFKGVTPLMLAYMYGKIKIADFLIRQGANVLAKDDHGRSLDYYKFLALQVIYNTKDLNKIAFELVSNGYLGDLKILVRYTTDINWLWKWDRNDYTWIKKEHFGYFRLYKSFKLESSYSGEVHIPLVTTASPFSMDILEYAVYKQDYFMAQYLIEIGIPVHRTDNQITALMLAAQSGKLGIVKLLLESGADLFDARNFYRVVEVNDSIKYSVDTMQAIHFASTKEIRNYLKAEMKKQRPGFFQRLFNRSPK